MFKFFNLPVFYNTRSLVVIIAAIFQRSAVVIIADSAFSNNYIENITFHIWIFEVFCVLCILHSLLTFDNIGSNMKINNKCKATRSGCKKELRTFEKMCIWKSLLMVAFSSFAMYSISNLKFLSLSVIVNGAKFCCIKLCIYSGSV